MTDLEACKKALEEGDVLAFAAVADNYQEQGLPDADDLSLLADDIVSCPDALIVTLAMNMFLLILEKKNG